jgi:hypothetical protein
MRTIALGPMHWMAELHYFSPQVRFISFSLVTNAEWDGAGVSLQSSHGCSMEFCRSGSWAMHSSCSYWVGCTIPGTVTISVTWRLDPACARDYLHTGTDGSRVGLSLIGWFGIPNWSTFGEAWVPLQVMSSSQVCITHLAFSADSHTQWVGPSDLGHITKEAPRSFKASSEWTNKVSFEKNSLVSGCVKFLKKSHGWLQVETVEEPQKMYQAEPAECRLSTVKGISQAHAGGPWRIKT